MKNHTQKYCVSKTASINFLKTMLPVLFLAIVLSSCNWFKSGPGDNNVSDNSPADSVVINKDSLIFALTDQVLRNMKNKDYIKLSELFHPVSGARFSAYAFVDTSSDVTLTKTSFNEQLKKRNKLKWGSYDGSGEDILLTLEEYFNLFVYSADFVNAEKKSLNKINRFGNTENNIESAYKNCDFVEYHFSGFNKEYAGIDWCSLRLVVRKYNNKYYLVGVIHDQWTI